MFHSAVETPRRRKAQGNAQVVAFWRQRPVQAFEVFSKDMDSGMREFNKFLAVYLFEQED